MKSVIIPVDLSVQSLSLVHDVVKKNPGQQLTIHAIHMVRMPTDITDLMFVNKKKLYSQIPQSFTEAVQALRNKYTGQVHLQFDLYYGSNASFLNRMIESKNISAAYLFSDFEYNNNMKQSVDFIPFFNKCKVPVYQTQMKNRQQFQGKTNLLSTLLGTEEKLYVKEKGLSLSAS